MTGRACGTGEERWVTDPIYELIHDMIDGGNGLTSWFLFGQNKLTMFEVHWLFILITQLAESKVK